MKILITGGCGFLGSNLAHEALKKKYKLLIVDNLYRKGSTNNLHWLKHNGDFIFIHTDIRSSYEIEEIIKKHQPDVIFHLAGQVAMTTSIENSKMDFEINTIGSINVLEAVRKYSPNTSVIYSSTNKVYGDLEQFDYLENPTRYICKDFPDGFNEKVTLSFHSPYGCSKGAADQYMLDYSRIYGLKTVVFRHSSMYGGRQYSSFDQGWIGWFCQKALEIKKDLLEKPFTICGKGKQVRDVLHSSDVVELYFQTIDNIELVKGEAFNVGGGISNSLSLLELFDILEKELKIKLNYTNIAERISDQKVFIADTSKIEQLIGWQPKIKQIDGIRKMIMWLGNID